MWRCFLATVGALRVWSWELSWELALALASGLFVLGVGRYEFWEVSSEV